MSTSFHPTAIIDPQATIGEGTTIGPYSVIGPKVVLGKNNKIASHVVIEGNTKIGDNNIIFQFASVGAAPQDLKYQGEDSLLDIGSGNRIREFVTIQPGTKGGGMVTRIGNNNLFMANCHVGHDGIIGNSNVIANSSALAGHVTLGNGITIGGLCGIHQFTRIGDLCILSGGTMVVKDLPPFCMVQGDRATLIGINKIALERAGYSKEDILKVRKLYREVFHGEGVFSQKIESLRKSYADFAPGSHFLDFLSTSERGITFPRRGAEGEDSDS